MDFETVIRAVSDEQWATLAHELCKVAHSDATHYTIAFIVCNGQSVYVAEPDNLGESPILVLAFADWSEGDEDWLALNVTPWWLAHLGNQFGGFARALLNASAPYVRVVDDLDRSYGPRAIYARERGEEG